MRKYPRHWLFVFLSLVSINSACSSIKRRHVLSAELVSMTHSQLPEKYSLKRISITNESFCEDDKPIYNQGPFIGLTDQAILKAQKKHKATHIADISIFIEGDCAVISGTASIAIKKSKRHLSSVTQEESSAAPADEDMKNVFETF